MPFEEDMDLRLNCYDIQSNEFYVCNSGWIFVSGINGKINEVEWKLKNYFLFKE